MKVIFNPFTIQNVKNKNTMYFQTRWKCMVLLLNDILFEVIHIVLKKFLFIVFSNYCFDLCILILMFHRVPNSLGCVLW